MKRSTCVLPVPLLLLGLAVLLAAGAPALAIPVFTPPWVESPNDPHWSGGSTTSQSWEFWREPLGTVAPATWNNPNGPPSPYQPIGSSPETVAPGPLSTEPVNTWHVDETGGGFSLLIPNDPTPRILKVIHLQYTSDKAASGPPTTSPGGSASAGGVAGHGPSADGDFWYTYEWLITITPNPEFEFITLSFPASTNIGEVDVSTICVPEPSAMVLGGMGMIGMAAYCRWRRRR